jgi:hypothetical protein
MTKENETEKALQVAMTTANYQQIKYAELIPTQSPRRKIGL